DGIIRRYLRPHGVDYFHIGMDEVWPQIGADPRNPHRVVQPWCRCPRCAAAEREELLIRFTVRLCAHLKEQGIRHISLWNDQFARHMDIIDRLAAALKEAGVDQEVVVQWWHYGLNFPENLRPELGLRRWVTPMTGYFHWWVYQSLLRNIHGMIQTGVRNGATGAESYASYDRAFHREVTCLAEYAWRNNAGDLQGFRSRYAQYLFGKHWEEGLRAFAQLEAVVEPGDLHAFLRPLFYYPYTYVNKDLPYPRAYPGECLRALLADPAAAREKLNLIVQHASQARAGFLSLRSVANRPDVVGELAAESHRIEATAREFLALLEAVEVYAGALSAQDLAARRDAIAHARRMVADLLPLHTAMMRDVEECKQAPLVPFSLRELSALYSSLHRMLDRLDEASRLAQEGVALPGVEEVFMTVE
ncbi:MAG: hypothetical protein QHJ73_13335, partial [Armatimonadota bacterium]|nr:hypothetical protein [Armatimonadota bacterium]